MERRTGAAAEDEVEFRGEPKLTGSLALRGLVLNLNDTRTLNPFADAVRRLPRLSSGTSVAFEPVSWL